MFTPRQLSLLLLTLMLGAAPLLAQPEAADAGVSTPAPDDAADKPTATQTPPVGSEPAPKSSGARGNSPFDYHSSEEISDDLPVSFPVDI